MARQARAGPAYRTGRRPWHDAVFSCILVVVRLTEQHLRQCSEYLVLGLILLTTLWRGGKSLDATWMIAFVGGVVTLAWYWKARSRGATSREVPPLIWGLTIAFLGWSILSFLFSSTQNYGLDELMRDAACVLLFFWVIRSSTPTRPRARDREARLRLEEQGQDHDAHAMTFIKKMMLTIAVGTVLACVLGVIIYVFQPVNRFVGTFFDYRFHTDFWPNAWADYLLLTWPVVLLVALKKHVSILWGFLLLGFVFGCLMLSYSRGAFLAFLGQLVLLVLLRYSALRSEFFADRTFRIKERGKKMIFSVFFLAATAFLTFWIVNGFRADLYPVQDVSDKLTFSSDEGGSSVSERQQFWGQAFILMMKRPLFGWGPYSFRFVQPALQTTILATSDHPHNVFLKLGMERGVVTALLFLALLLIILARSKVRRLASESFPHALLIVGIVGVLAHNLIDYNLQFVAIALPFWLILGVLVRDTTQEGAGMPARRSPPEADEGGNKKVIRTFDLLLGLALLLIVIVEGRTLFLSSLGRQAHAAGREADALVWYDRASGEIFSRDMHLGRTQLYLKNNRLESAQLSLDTYFNRNAEDGRAWVLQGGIAMAHQDFRGALLAYEQADRVLRMNDLTPLRAMLEVINKIADKQKLDLLRPQIILVLERYADAIEHNTHFIALGHNVEEFLKITEFLADVYPDDAPKLQILGAKVDRHAKEERAKVKARAPGYLW